MNNGKEEYKNAFSKVYDSAAPEQYGGAEVTPRELGALRNLYAATKESLFGDVSIRKLSREDKELIRSLVVGRIVEEGWPVPEKVEAKDLAEAAIAHACVVAEHLIEERGVEASPDTFFSYTTKDQFDRFASMILLRSDRIKKGGDLHDEWHSPQDRAPGFVNPAVKYPEGLDSTKIYGVAKPHRYWPAQLLRIIEELRLGKMPEQKKNKLRVGDTNVKRYAIPWIDYRESIKGAESVDDVAVGVAVKTMEILHKRGLKDYQIVELIIAGYDPKGPMNEHGNIPQVHEIWSGILDRTENSKAGIVNLDAKLRTRLEQEIESIGHSFKYIEAEK